MTPLFKIEPPWYFDPLIVNQEIGRGVKIPYIVVAKIGWVGSSIYHEYGGQNNMDSGRYTMGRQFEITWVGESKYHV